MERTEVDRATQDLGAGSRLSLLTLDKGENTFLSNAGGPLGLEARVNPWEWRGVGLRGYRGWEMLGSKREAGQCHPRAEGRDGVRGREEWGVARLFLQ